MYRHPLCPPFYHIQLSTSQPDSAHGVLHFPTLTDISIHGAALSLPLPAQLQGWSSTVMGRAEEHFEGYSMWPGLPSLICPTICTSRRQIVSLVPAPSLKLHKPWPGAQTFHSPSQNVLLDAALTPRVADFGFVTPLPINVGSTAIVTAAGAMTLAGSRGYLAPEFSDGKHGIKSDVYSYGVVS